MMLRTILKGIANFNYSCFFYLLVLQTQMTSLPLTNMPHCISHWLTVFCKSEQMQRVWVLTCLLHNARVYICVWIMSQCLHEKMENTIRNAVCSSILIPSTKSFHSSGCLLWKVTFCENKTSKCVCFCMSQISQKKLKKYEKEYHTIREQQEQQEAPIERYEVILSLSCVQGFTHLHSRLCGYEYLQESFGRVCLIYAKISLSPESETLSSSK